MALTFLEAKQIPIPDFLSRLGIEPKRIRGNDYWYLSPFRNERNPSFKVDIKLNVWFDHGIGEGGTLLDLGARMHSCSISEFLSRINDEPPYRAVHFRDASRENKLEILSKSPLQDPDLVKYLSHRGIDTHDAKVHCLEVHFQIANKQYKAVGFLNRSGGYELRNHWFKGSSSPKDISLVKGNSGQVCVMEGFVDFLSFLKLHRSGFFKEVSNPDFLVLNSISLLKKNLSLLQQYEERTIFFDNDGAGKMGKALLRRSGLSFLDGADLYSGFKDLNEFLCNAPGSKNSMTRSFGLRR